MDRYTCSQEHLARAERTIPGGIQTLGKSRSVYPYGVSPYFATHGRGSHVWDVDGNEYIDFVSGLGAVTLGYDDPDVNGAVQEQLKSGVIFSLSHPLEARVAEKLVELVPCAEMVCFGKTGSEVTTAAVRLARAYTGRDHVAVCGYHSWHDWYIGCTTRNLGVPKSTQVLTHTFDYNDADSLRRLFAQCPEHIAAVILEPMSTAEPMPGYLESVVDISHAHGALVIFDEMVTGFRCAQGGAQELFSVTPDLATFGKGLVNGYPLTALAGNARVMRVLEDIFFSVTHGGEALSLAAAMATLTKLSTHPVIETITRHGARLKKGVQELIARHDVGHIVGISGHPTWTFLHFMPGEGYTELQIQTLFLQEMLVRGILTGGAHFTSYAHSNRDIDKLLEVYDEVLPFMRRAVNGHVLDRHLRCEPLAPLFRVRSNS